MKKMILTVVAMMTMTCGFAKTDDYKVEKNVERYDMTCDMRRLAVKLNGLRPLCMLVQSVPGRYYHSADFAKDLWKVASEYDLLEAAPQAYLTGKILMDLGVKPGKQMGEIIKQSFELQLDGKITTVEDAVEWARAAIST